MKPVQAAALTLTSLLFLGCQNSGQTGTTTTTTNASAPVAMSTVAPDDHSQHGSMTSTTGTPGASDPHDAMKMGTKGVDALRQLKGKEFDVAFLSQMITHHEGAVKMAQDALKVAKRPETKDEAQKVIDAQAKEIEQMKGWLKEWHNAEPSKEQQDLVHQDMQHMESMPVTDDHTFFDMMIPHHQGAIDMSALVNERAERPELKEFAQKVTSDQQKEIERYKTLNEGH
jgi:uncharacterized protein (DUF305 family)